MKHTLLYIVVLTIFFSKSHGSKGGPIAVSGSFSSSSSSSHSSAYSSSSSGSFTFNGNAGVNEIDGLKSYSSAVNAAAGAGAGAGAGAISTAGTGAYSTLNSGSINGAKSQDSANLNLETIDSNNGNIKGALSGCCKGPFPGPTGSIHDSKPASSVPVLQANPNQQPSLNSAPISPINVGTSYSGASAGVGAGASTYFLKPESLLSIITSFPGPSGSIHTSKPATGEEPSYKNPTIIATIPVSNGGNNYNFNYKPASHTPVSPSVISSLPGAQGSIHTSKPALSENPSQNYGNQPIQSQQPFSPGLPSVISSFPATPGNIHASKPAKQPQGFPHQSNVHQQKPISNNFPSTIGAFPGAPGDIHSSKPANPSYINQPIQPSAPGSTSPSLINSFPGGTDNIHTNNPPTIPSQTFNKQPPFVISPIGGSYNTGSTTSSSGSSSGGTSLTGSFIASLPGPSGSIHQSKPISSTAPINNGNYAGNNYRPIVGPICYNKPGQSCQNTVNQLPPSGASAPNNYRPIVGPICFNKPGQNCQNTQNQIPPFGSTPNAPTHTLNENRPPPNNYHPIVGPICSNGAGQNCQNTQNQLPPTTNVPSTTINQDTSSLANSPLGPNCSYQPGANNPCKILPTNLLPPSNENINFGTPKESSPGTSQDLAKTPQDKTTIQGPQEPLSSKPIIFETTTHLVPESSSELSIPVDQGCKLGSKSCNNEGSIEQKKDNLEPSINTEVPTTAPPLQPNPLPGNYQPLKPGQVITTGTIISGEPGIISEPDGSFPSISQELLPPYTTILNHPGAGKPCCQGPYPGPDGSIHDSKPLVPNNDSNKNDETSTGSLDEGKNTNQKLNETIIFMDHDKDSLGENAGIGSSASSSASIGADGKTSGFVSGNVLIQKADGTVIDTTNTGNLNDQYKENYKGPNVGNAEGSGFATGNVLIQNGDTSTIIDRDRPLNGGSNNDGFLVIIKKEGPNSSNGCKSNCGSGNYGATSISSYGPLGGSENSNSVGSGGSFAQVGTYGTGNAGNGASYGCSTGKCNAGGVISGNGAYAGSVGGGYGFGGGSNFASPEHGVRELGNLFNNLFGKNNFATSGSGSFSKSGSYAGASSFASASSGSYSAHY